MRDCYLISDENSIVHWVNSAAHDCLPRLIRSDIMTVASLYKAELLQSSHEQESKNEKQRSISRQIRTEAKTRT